VVLTTNAGILFLCEKRQVRCSTCLAGGPSVIEEMEAEHQFFGGGGDGGLKTPTLPKPMPGSVSGKVIPRNSLALMYNTGLSWSRSSPVLFFLKLQYFLHSTVFGNNNNNSNNNNVIVLGRDGHVSTG